MNLDLSGKSALVCGSTQGIGKAAAHELALLGANVTLLARNEERLKLVVSDLPVKSMQQHDYAVADFASLDQLQSVISEITKDKPFHILINNTGGPPAGLAIDASVDEYIKAFTSHLLGNQILAQAMVPGMKANGYGRIINVISTSVKIPIKGLGVSNTIRGAVANWSKTLANELAIYGITVNNVLPGASMTGRLESIMQNRSQKFGKTMEQVKREMEDEIPAGRISTPEEVAAAIAFLASPAAGYINGVNLPVDGGRTGAL